MTDVDVAILHAEPSEDAGPLTLATALARRTSAEAHRQGLHDQERMLREQIRWALPVNEPEEV